MRPVRNVQAEFHNVILHQIPLLQLRELPDVAGTLNKCSHTSQTGRGCNGQAGWTGSIGQLLFKLLMRRIK